MEKEFTRSRQKNPLDTMASGIAHKLNNILYPIAIYSNMLLSEAEPGSEVYLDLSEILDCAIRAGDLVSKIRIYSGHIAGEKKVSDLAVIISETMKSIRATNPVTITFEEQICGDKMPALCDAAQISQVLTNLCTNSVQAIENAGKIQITMEPMTLDGFECLDGTILSGEHARLTVTDNGVGMHEATLTRIFDPFFTTHTQATGLGLSTVIGIVRSHGGGISVSSKPGVGTTIEVFLPLAEGITEVLPD
jgi:signal transduction histidine kinase